MLRYRTLAPLVASICASKSLTPPGKLLGAANRITHPPAAASRKPVGGARLKSGRVLNPIGKKKIAAPAPWVRVQPASLVSPGTTPQGITEPKGAGPTTFGRFLAVVDPKVAEGVLVGLSGSVKGLTRFLANPPAKPAEYQAQLAARIEKVAKDLEQAISDGVQAALDPDQRQVVAETMRILGGAIGALASGGLPEKFPSRATSAFTQLREICGLTQGAPAVEPPLLVLDVQATRLDALFDGPLPPSGAVQLYSEGPLGPTSRGLLAEVVTGRSGALELTDVNTNLSGKLWCEAGRLLTDRPDWAVGTGPFALSEALRSGELAAQVKAAEDAQVGRLALVVPQWSAAVLVELSELLRRRGTIEVELLDPSGKSLAKLDPSGALTIQAPERVTGELHEGYRQLIRSFLYHGVGRSLTIPANGELIRTSGGFELKGKGGPAPLLKDLQTELWAHRGANALSPGAPDAAEAQALRAVLRAAQNHLERQVGVDHAELLHPEAWSAAMETIVNLAQVPGQGARLGRVLRDIEAYSEHPEHPGFGNGLFRGVALGANSAALLSLLAGETNLNQVGGLLLEAMSLLGPQGKGVTAYGATMEMLAQKSGGEWARRASAADEHNAFLRLIDEALRSNVDSKSELRICAIPTDPGQGAARTATPDFVVEQLGDPNRTIFLDAKSIDARYFAGKKQENVRTATHQVLAHRFRLGQQSEAWPLIRLYHAPSDPQSQQLLLAEVQAGLQAGLTENPSAKTGNQARLRSIVVLDQGSEQQTYLVGLKEIRPLREAFFKIGVEDRG